MPRPRVPERLIMLSTIVAGLGGAWLVVMHARMVLSPAPQEMREGAVVWITQLLLEGRNPYSLTELPEGANVYGIFYHLVVLPFARVFGNSFAVHRIVSAAAILGACALLYRMLRRMEVSRALSAIGVLVLYSSSVYFTSPLARPDSLGLLLSLASLTLLFRDRVTPAAFAGGLAFALCPGGASGYRKGERRQLGGAVAARRKGRSMASLIVGAIAWLRQAQ